MHRAKCDTEYQGVSAVANLVYQSVSAQRRADGPQAKSQLDVARDAAARGDYDTVMGIAKTAPNNLSWYYVCANAAKANHTRIVEATVGFLRDAWEMSWPLSAAVEAGRWPIVAFLWRELTARYDPVLPSTVVGQALERGCDDLQRLIDLCGTKAVMANMSDDVWLYIRDSKIDAMELMCQLLSGEPDVLIHIMNHAAAAYRSDIVIYLCESGLCQPNAETMQAAVHSTEEACVHYLHARGIAIPNEAEDSMLARQIQANAMWACGLASAVPSRES